MIPAPNPTPVQALAPDLARRFGLIVAGLAALVAHRFLREPRLASLIIPLWTRLTRTARRFDRLMASLAANRPSKPRPTRPHRAKPDTARATTPLPTGHGWLIRALPQEAAAYAAQLESLLAEPATADLLAAPPPPPASSVPSPACSASAPSPRSATVQSAAPGCIPTAAPRARPSRRSTPTHPTAQAQTGPARPGPPSARAAPIPPDPSRPATTIQLRYRI